MGFRFLAHQCWEIRSVTVNDDPDHFVSLRASSALFTNMVDHNLNVANVVNLGTGNPKVSQKICYIEK